MKTNLKIPEICLKCENALKNICHNCIHYPKDINIKPVENLIPKTYDYQEGN